MSPATQAPLPGNESAPAPVLYLAIEMAEKTWKLLFSSGEVKANGQLRVYQRTVDGSDYAGVDEAIKQARARFQLSPQASVLSCYEAGQDGFWPHRQLTEKGIINRVVDSASIEVNRRSRRAKTDQLDVRKLLEMRVRVERGERGVWREVRVPSVEQADQRRLHRELERLKQEEKQHSTRLRSLLKLQGIRPEGKPGGRGWQGYLAQLESVLPAGAWAELVRESERLALVKNQRRTLEAQQQERLARGANDDSLMQQILYQPNSALSQWFQKRFGGGGKRQRRIGIVALARRLLVALWRYVDQGIVPDGAELKPAR